MCARPTASTLSSQQSSEAKRFLVVDDEADLLSVTEMVLHTWGHQTQSFTDPRKALDAFRVVPNEFSVALIDIRMPHMSGPELAKEILRIRADLPIVFMTAFEFDPVAFAGLPLVYKSRDVVRKPYAPMDLCKVVKEHVAASSA